MKKNRESINWHHIYETPLDVALAKHNAKRISDHNAKNQIATALHEAIHLIYAVKHGYAVLYVAVASSPKGGVYNFNTRSKGFTADFMPAGVKGLVESYTAACILEYELDNDSNNFIATNEENLALKSAKTIIRKELQKNPCSLSASFTSDVGILDDALETTANEYFGFYSPLIKSIAKAILYYREGKDGKVHPDYVASMTDYVRDYIEERLPDHYYIGGIQNIVNWISPAVKRQNEIEKKRHDKWLRESEMENFSALINSGVRNFFNSVLASTEIVF